MMLQVIAAIIALRHIRLTGRHIAWILIAAALLLMTFRRIIPFYNLLTGNPSFQPELFNEVIGLVLSLFLVIGIAKIGSVFSTIKFSQESLKDTEEKYRSLFNNANDAIYLIEYDTKRILDFNKKASEMIGYSLEEMQAMTFLDLHPNNEKKKLQSKLKELFDKGSLKETLPLHHRKKNSIFVSIEMNISLIEMKGKKMILSVVRDVTDRKRSEEKIRLFYHATDSSVEAICFYHLDKRIMYLNDSFEKMFGYTRDELIGKNISILYPEETIRMLQKALQNTPDGGWVGELTAQRKDGTLFPISVSSSRIFDDSGNIIARMISQKDITEIKRSEEKMIFYTEQLRSLSDRLVTIREEERLNLAREIHDGFGSSLTGLKMELMLLKRNFSENFSKQSDTFISRYEVFKNIQSMADLIDSTIVLMRKLVTELRPEILDELGLVEAVRWYIKEFEKRTNVKFRLTIFPKNIKTDTKRDTTIFRIFQEILINIARHSYATEAVVFLKKQKGIVYLSIHDNGIGIKEEEINNKKSLGILGMRERALIFGGKLEIKGIEGVGTSVHVEIPVKSE